MRLLSYGEAIRSKARSKPDRPAITDAMGTISRADADRMSDQAAMRLMEVGVSPGDVVACTGPNETSLLLLAIAIWKVGATPLPLSEKRETSELESLLALANPAVAVGFSNHIRSPGIALDLPGMFVGSHAGSAPKDMISDRFRIGASGGSTGTPKLIVIDKPAVLDPEAPRLFGMQADGVLVVPLNLVDGAGFVMAAEGLATGNHVVLLPDFDPELTLWSVARYQADWLGLTPPLMLQIWKLGDAGRARYDLSALRAASQFSGGAAAWLKRAWIDWLGPERVLETYGATEAPASLRIDGTEWLKHPGSVGRENQTCEVSIRDNDSRVLPPNSVGDIYLRNVTGEIPFHYLGSDANILADGWVNFGDVGWLNSAGYLHIGDRKSDVICKGDLLIFPREIEGILEQHEAVRSAIVVGLPDDTGSERLHALIDAPGGTVTVDALRNYCARVLSPDKQPRSFEFCEGPLRNSAGKARRSRIRAARIPFGHSTLAQF